MTHDYKRNGTTTLFAALNVLDGTVIGRNMARHRHQEFIRFLNAIETAAPPPPPPPKPPNNPYFPDYGQYIAQRKRLTASVSRKDYFYDILLSFDKEGRHRLVRTNADDVACTYNPTALQPYRMRLEVSHHFHQRALIPVLGTPNG